MSEEGSVALAMIIFYLNFHFVLLQITSCCWETEVPTFVSLSRPVYPLYAADHLKVLINYKEFREKQPFLTQLFGEKVKNQKYIVCGKEQRLRNTMLRNVRGMNRKDAKGFL